MSLDFDRYSDRSESPVEQQNESAEVFEEELQSSNGVEQHSVLAGEAERANEKAHALLPAIELFESSQNQPDQAQKFMDSPGEAVNHIVAKPVGPAAKSESDLNVKSIPTTGQPGNENLRSDSLKRLADKNFDRLDTDHDGFIDKSELDAAMVNPAFKGEDAQLIGALKRHRENLEELSNDEWGDENDGITRADIEEFSKLVTRSDKDSSEEKLVGEIDRLFYRSGQTLGTASHELFANKSNPLSSVNPEAVKQGRIGDCYLMAAMAAVAATPEGKQAIINMIKHNADGTYTVTFPGDPSKPVTIQPPTDAELGLYAQGSPHGTWPAVLEKAYGKYCNANNVDLHDGIRRGAVTAVGLKLLTGRDVDTDLLELTSKEDTHKKLAEAMWHGRPVTAATRAEPGKLAGLSDGLTDDAGIPSGHLYTIESYDPATRMVTIRNPWGYGETVDANGKPIDGNDDGVFTMTLDQFYKNFMRVSYVENPR